MAKYNHDIVNTTINLFKNGKIICKNLSLAKKVISHTQKIITIFKKQGNIDEINKINEIYKSNEKTEITTEMKSMFLNMIRLCMSKLSFGKASYIYSIIQNYVIPAAFKSKNRNGGYISHKKIASGHLSSKYKDIQTFMQLKLIDSNVTNITPKGGENDGGQQ